MVFLHMRIKTCYSAGFLIQTAPKHIFVVHGEEQPANHLAETVREQRGWQFRAGLSGRIYLD